jgi:hypothetical protein
VAAAQDVVGKLKRERKRQREREREREREKGEDGWRTMQGGSLPLYLFLTAVKCSLLSQEGNLTG